MPLGCAAASARYTQVRLDKLQKPKHGRVCTPLLVPSPCSASHGCSLHRAQGLPLTGAGASSKGHLPGQRLTHQVRGHCRAQPRRHVAHLRTWVSLPLAQQTLKQGSFARTGQPMLTECPKCDS